MADIFPLKPADKSKLHVCAWNRMQVWKAAIVHEIPQLGDASLAQFKKDAVKFLSQEEQKLFGDAQVKVNEWLGECINGKNYWAPFNQEIDQDLDKMKELLKAIYQRKEQAIKEEHQRVEAEERRVQFLADIQPLILIAKTQLNSDEYKVFENSIPGAVDAWLEFGSGYQTDARAYNFVSYMMESQQRQEQKKLHQAAEAEAEKYNCWLSAEIDKLKAALSQKKDAVEYFEEHVTDPRYSGHKFSDLFDENKLQDIRNNIQKIVRQKLGNLIPVDLGESIDSKSSTDLFLLPSADYSFEQMPCLSFDFDVFAVISTEIWFKPVTKDFGGLMFTLTWISQKNDVGQSAQPKESERLGYQYYLLTPTDLGSISWQMIPLSLIKSLWDDEIEAEGVTILKVSEEGTLYQVEDFEDEIWLPSTFSTYIKELGNIDKTIDAGVISKKAAGILTKKLEQLDAVKKSSSTNNPSLLPSAATTGKITKKKLAYHLFKEGKVPTSPEIKALGLHKSTRCKYYNQWLADGKP